MRLRTATIDGFRGFTRKVSIDLDADVIILHGPNGAGKTSLLDAVLWALTGRIDRFAERGKPISIYAREGIARVELALKDGHRDLVVTRATDGSRDTIRLRVGDDDFDGAVAESHLSELLLPQLRERAEAATVIANVLTRGVYLQQDLVRQFIETDTPAQRFQLIGEIIGAGAVLELQTALERSRNQWSRNTTSVQREALDPLLQQLTRLNEQISRLDSVPPTETVEARGEATRLFADAVELIGRSRLSIEEAPTTSTGLDRLLREIAGERAGIERELSAVRALLDETRDLAGTVGPDEDQLNELVAQEAAAARELTVCDADVEASLQASSRLQERRLADRNLVNRLATMAQLALDELGDTCPVCQQRHDRRATEHHLRALIAASSQWVEPLDTEAGSLEVLNARRNSQLVVLEAIRTKLRDVRAAHQEINARYSIYRARLKDVGVESGVDPATWLSARTVMLEERISRVSALLRRGETLTLSVIRLGEQRRRAELRQERDILQPKIVALNEEIAKLDKTHALAGQIIAALRRASLDVTRRQVEDIRPLFQRIYSRIDPHPTFRVTEITTAMERGRGLLRMGVSDPDQSAEMYDALPILSSSQLNSFAVSLFLALNLGLPSLNLDLVMLDDPLQSLDSINLLGLVDVLRRFREHRQVIVSTHEPRFLGLLQRKLRPVRPGKRMMTLYFEGWTREGPDFRTVESEYIPDAPRVLAA